MNKIKKHFRFFYENSLVRFLGVGFLGLMSDTSVLYALKNEIGLIPAKILSYIVALSVTWILNRILTFRSEDPNRLGEWLRYTLVYLITGVVHVLLFAALVREFAILHTHPAGALFITAVIIAMSNFLITKRYVFVTPAA